MSSQPPYRLLLNATALDKTALQIMSQAVRSAAPVQRQRGVVAAVGVHHQRARPVLEERMRYLPPRPTQKSYTTPRSASKAPLA